MYINVDVEACHVIISRRRSKERIINVYVGIILYWFKLNFNSY